MRKVVLMLALIVTVTIPRVGLAGPSFVVLDKHNQTVGVFENNSVIKRINGIWFFLPVLPSGFESDPQPGGTFYTNTDCTGQPYLFEFLTDVPLVRTLDYVFNNVATYGDLTKAATLTMNSALIFSVNAPPTCNTAAQGGPFPFTGTFAPPVDFDLSLFKLVPPFKVAKQP
jgi:hypothetical protein